MISWRDMLKMAVAAILVIVIGAFGGYLLSAPPEIFPPAHAQTLNISATPVVSASAEKGHVLKAAPGHLYAAYATNLTTTAGFFAIIDAAAVPGDGAIVPLACIPLPASGAASFNYVPTPPAQFTTGITAVVTSASSCFTMTSGTITAFISGLVQ